MFYAVKLPRFKRREYEVVGDFFEEHRDRRHLIQGASYFVGAVSLPGVAHAADTTDLILDAFNPIIDVVQAAAYPLAYIWTATGALIIITGNRSRGVSMIKQAGIGYLVVQFVPSIMKLLHNVGNNIGKVAH